MSGRIYWLVAAILVAVVTHLSFILFAPKLVMADRLDAMREAAGLSTLKILSRPETLRLVGEGGDRLVHAICVYDLGEAPLLVNAVIPPSYWSISLYSAAGDNFYSFNDRQADVERLTILIRSAPAVTPGEEASETRAPEGDTLEIFPPTPRGVVVFRALAGEVAERPGIEALLARSTCASAS